MNVHVANEEFTYAELFVHVVNRIWFSTQQKVFQELLPEGGFGDLEKCFTKFSQIINIVKLFEAIAVVATRNKMNRLKSC